MAERSPTYEMIQRAPMLFEEHLENIGSLQGQIFEELDAPGEWFLNEESSTRLLSTEGPALDRATAIVQAAGLLKGHMK